MLFLKEKFSRICTSASRLHQSHLLVWCRVARAIRIVSENLIRYERVAIRYDLMFMYSYWKGKQKRGKIGLSSQIVVDQNNSISVERKYNTRTCNVFQRCFMLANPESHFVSLNVWNDLSCPVLQRLLRLYLRDKVLYA